MKEAFSMKWSFTLKVDINQAAYRFHIHIFEMNYKGMKNLAMTNIDGKMNMTSVIKLSHDKLLSRLTVTL